MTEKSITPTDLPPIFAVFQAGNCVFAGPRFLEEIEERSCLSDLIKSRRRLTSCPPWQILTNRFTLKGNEHALLSFVPDEGNAPTRAEVELAALPLTEFFRDLLICTDPRFTVIEPLSPKLLFAALSRDLSSEICDRIAVTPPLGIKEGLTEIAPRGLYYAIGLLLASYYYGGENERTDDAALSLLSLPEEYQIQLKIPMHRASDFLVDLLDALASASKFTITREQDVYLFSLPATRASALPLRAHPEAELPELLLRVRRLFSDQK